MLPPPPPFCRSSLVTPLVSQLAPSQRCRAGQCKACGAWNALEKVTVAPAAEAGGGSGARAAARFAAGKSAGGGSMDGGPGGGFAAAARPLRRSAWVQEVEGALAWQRRLF